jgi:hypothetical protein
MRWLQHVWRNCGVSDLFAAVKAIPIDSVIRDFYPNLTLRCAGRDLLSKCPLHKEATPSFRIYLEKNTWYCFGACASGGSNIDLLLKGGLASDPLNAAKLLALRFGVETRTPKPKPRAGVLTVAQYAGFCALPTEFLIERFALSNSDAGVEIPYKGQSGETISVQCRHRLEKGPKKDGRFSWHQGDKVLPYGLWLLPKDSRRLIVVEGASDVHVLSYCGAAALGIPGAGNFKPEMASSLLSFGELVLIREPGPAGETFIGSIVAALKSGNYNGVVRVIALPAKDPRELWVSYKDQNQFAAKLKDLITTTSPVDLYPPVPRAADLISAVEALLLRHMFFKDRRYALLIAVWVLGTYLYDVFCFFGYLWVNSPVKRSGKSRLLDILERITANATPRLNNASEAAIFRIAAKKHTMLLDEVEHMRGQDREKYASILTLLNAGFSAGARVPRCEKIDGEIVVNYFDVFCPKILAGINQVVDTIEDRCFKVPMVRKAPDESVERFNVRRQGQELGELRRDLEIWAAARRKEVETVYDGVDELAGLEG